VVGSRNVVALLEFPNPVKMRDAGIVGSKFSERSWKMLVLLWTDISNFRQIIVLVAQMRILFTRDAENH
jgi:hypothetical protein